MAAHFVGNSVIVRLIWTIGGNVQMMNVLAGTKGSLVVNQTTTNTLGAAIKSAFTSSALVARVHSSVSLANIGLRDYSVANQAEFLDTGAAVAGTATGDPLPRGTAFAVTLRTALAGQRYRGRVYLGGFAEGDNDTTASSSTAIGTAAVAFIAAIDSALQGQGSHLAVLSHPADQKQVLTTISNPDGSTTVHTKTHAARPGAITPTTLIQARNQTWDSQRRRTLVGSTSTRMIEGMFAETP